MSTYFRVSKTYLCSMRDFHSWPVRIDPAWTSRCWGSSSQMPEVARNCRAGAEGSEGHWKPGGYPLDQRSENAPKVSRRSRRLTRPEGPRELPKVQRGEWRSTADPKVTVNLRGSVSIMNIWRRNSATLLRLTSVYAFWLGRKEAENPTSADHQNNFDVCMRESE